jgi:predicted permease
MANRRREAMRRPWPALRRAAFGMRHSVVAIATIALALGSTIAAFSVVNGAVLRPPAIAGLDRIVTVEISRQGGGGPSFSPERLERLTSRGPRLLESWVGVAGDQANISTDSVSHPVVVEMVSGPYFDLFHVRPLVGRLLTARDSRADDGCCAAVISEGVWRHVFGANEKIVGADVHLLSRAFTIVGIAPKTFRGVRLPQLISTDVWIPGNTLPRPPPAMGVFAALRPTASFAAAQQEIRSLAGGLDPDDPEVGAEVLPAWRGMVPPPLIVIGAVTGIAGVVTCVAILLLAGATATNLSRARCVSRRQEFAVRLALGADESHLMKLAIADALGVTIPAVLVGSALAMALVRVVQTMPLMPAAGALAPMVDATPNITVWVFAAAAAVGLSLFLARAEVAAIWRSPHGLSPGSFAFGGVARRIAMPMHFGAWQLGLATALLVVAGLFFRGSLNRIQRDSAFPTAHAVVGHVQFDSRDAAAGASVLSRLLATSLLPGERLGLATDLPLPGSTGIARAGVAYGARSGSSALTHVIGVSPGFLDALGVPLVSGMALPALADAYSDAAVVDETLARALWPSGQAVGHRLWLAGSDDSLEVVGVVRAPTTSAGLEDFRRFVFVPIATRHPIGFDVLLKGPGSNLALVATLQRLLRAVDPSVALTDPQPLGDYADPYAKLAAAALRPTMVAAGLAIVLALAGLYAVVNHNVTSRLYEFGIRNALGAPHTRIYAQVIRECLATVSRGTAIGVAIALPLPLLLPKPMLFALRLDDVLALALVPVIAFVVALVALLPAAYRATRSDPLVAMRAS